ncbi:MAG: D-glycero-beta-D-manno-heptose-7-phosphate kinase [Fluviicola sp. XM-24bin1]|mgnify:CR=1 FL=1|nr:MAG: D-glycero-beta-D-manno-heptose-7-phosphate kinase [Fluviicola sp. XM-24bin1]
MDISTIFSKFESLRILVIGDVMIDAYVEGSVTRVSPEAPVPIVNLKNRTQRLGGAANVALNLAALGATPVLTSIIGNDEGGEDLINLMEEAGMVTSGMEKSRDRKTTVKTRVIGNQQQLLRIDDEIIAPLTIAEEDQIIANVSKHLNEIDAIIFEDYNKGVLTSRVITEVIAMARESDVITTVDPKKEHFFEYRNVTMFKPNLKELKEGLNIDAELVPKGDAFEQAIAAMEEKLQNEISFVTLSEHGVFIQKSHSKHYVPAHIRNISDVSGAGDTVISVATACLAAGMEIRDVAEWANLAGGLVCERTGVVPVDKQQLQAEIVKLEEA